MGKNAFRNNENEAESDIGQMEASFVLEHLAATGQIRRIVEDRLSYRDGLLRHLSIIQKSLCREQVKNMSRTTSDFFLK